MKKLENKVAVVTGVAMGNGLGIVKVFLKYGAKVAILDYAEKLSQTVEELKKEYPENVEGYMVDIRQEDKVEEAIEKTIEKFGKIDILINNAGVCRLENFMKMNNELRDFHFDINIKGTWNVSKSCIK